MQKIQGLIAASFTPFLEDGALNLEMIPVIVEKLVNDRVTGLFVCGSNGEGPNMTTEERMQVAEAFVSASKGRLITIIHVGHSSIRESKKLAAHAASIGALSVGARGAIGSTYTFAAPLFLKTMELFNGNKNELARQQHSFLVEMIKIFAQFPSIPAQKAIMKMLTWNMGPCRLPLVTLSSEHYDKLYRQLDEISFFEKIQPAKISII